MKIVPCIGVMPPLPFKLYARRPSRMLPFPLGEHRCRIFSLARQGLFMGIKAPIQSDRKEELLDRLAWHGIAALNFWSVPHPSLPVADFPRAAALRESIIALPVHQELGVRELKRIVDAVLDGVEYI
jgi:hypothetical protein